MSQNRAVNEDWSARQEDTNVYWLTALWWVCKIAGRTITRRTLLVVITIVFFCRDRAARMASREYLSRVYGRTATRRDIFAHMFTFASVTMDRLFLLAGKEDIFDVEMTGEAAFDDLDQGAILITAHFGSFDIMRVLGKQQRDLTIHILLDKAHNAQTMAFLCHLNPEMADRIVDAGTPGPQLVVQLSNLLSKNRLLGIMADRVLPGQRTMTHSFLGQDADFPIGPWALAVVLDRPLIYCFGTYEGGRRYRITFEKFDATGLTGRTAARAQVAAAHYIERLEYHVRRAPLNWFNFYRFWSETSDGIEDTN